MNLDWDQAPEGAEAGHPGGDGVYAAWFRKDTAGLVEQICPEAGIYTWTWMGGRKDFPVGSLIRPPILLGHASYASQWNGESRPPVGTVCEWKERTGFTWVKATVLFISESSVVMQREDGFEWQMLTKRTVFRPIRTPEQIAAEERLKKAIELYGAVMNHSGQQFKSLPAERQEHYMSLIDAGWQKVPRA